MHNASKWSGKTCKDDFNHDKINNGICQPVPCIDANWDSTITKQKQNTTLSQAMREVISIMCLLQVAADQDINFIDSKTKVHCTFYKDNAEALKIAKVPKLKQGHVTWISIVTISEEFKKEKLSFIMKEQKIRRLIPLPSQKKDCSMSSKIRMMRW